MPIFFQQDIDDTTRLGIWKIEEDESFFLKTVPLQRTITHPHKRLQHLAGRYLLRYLFPDFPTELICIADTRKPFLEDEAYHFSISHCSDYAAVVVSSQNRVGIDIEVVSEKVTRIQHKFLHEEERKSVNRESSIVNGEASIVNEKSADLPDAGDLQRQLTILWSAKEAMFKWWGRGQVDFSEMLRVEGSALPYEGVLKGNFVQEPVNVFFPVHFKIFPEIVLAWVRTDGSIFL